MAPRLELQALLTSITEHVYFQPPESIKMQYPCIRYERDYLSRHHADDVAYVDAKRYTITVMDRDPDSEIPDLVAALPMCSFDRHYVADGLNHDVYKLFF